MYRGYEQMPVTGTSMRVHVHRAPTRRPPKSVQYFEMMGHRAIYADGWKAVTRHQPKVAFDDDQWELYHVAEDRSECNDLAAAEPERLAELVELWWKEAEEHGVLPLDDRTVELFGARFRDRSPHPDEPALHVPAADDAAAGASGRVDRRPQLGSRRRRSSAPRARAACSTRPAPRTPA